MTKYMKDFLHGVIHNHVLKTHLKTNLPKIISGFINQNVLALGTNWSEPEIRFFFATYWLLSITGTTIIIKGNYKSKRKRKKNKAVIWLNLILTPCQVWSTDLLSSYWNSGAQLGVMRVVIVEGISCFYAPAKKTKIYHLNLHMAN